MAAVVSFALGILFVITAACEGNASKESEAAMVEAVLSEFFRQAYAPDGNIDLAYELMSEQSQASCSRDDFERMVTVGRESLLFRQPTLRIQDTDVREERARIEVTVELGTFTNPLFPPEVIMHKDDDEWRYVIATDPTCQSAAAFYDLKNRPGVVPGRDVTPVSEGNPDCDPAYPLTCIPSPPPDLDCSDLGFGFFPAREPDPHGFDTDGDGFGCEDNQPREP